MALATRQFAIYCLGVRIKDTAFQCMSLLLDYEAKQSLKKVPKAVRKTTCKLFEQLNPEVSPFS